MICPQDVAQHSFNVCNLVRLLGGSMYAQLAAIHHDMGEYACSDVPSPVKRILGAEAKGKLETMELNGLIACGIDDIPLNEKDAKILKIADNLEGLITCIEEVRMGNRDLVAVGGRYAEYLIGDDEYKLVSYYLKEWRELPK
jgi:5'-deoxynucleotidase YfbR-like HD superfamily hydrolase